MFHWPEYINSDIINELTNTTQSNSENGDEENKDCRYVEILKFIIINYNINFNIDII